MTKEELKEFHKLEEENKQIRKSIQKCLDELNKKSKIKKYWDKLIWEKINELINNEIEQEDYCNI